MRKILFFIAFLSCITGEAQVIRANPFYRPFAGQANLLLDDYPGAAAAYSLRRLDKDYTGNCIKIRRNSDNTETDIGFSGDVVDTSAIKSFCGSSSGAISVWYDQSGNGRNLSQSTALSQPLICISGTIIRNQNGKPIVSTSNGGSNSFLQSSNYVFNDAVTMFTAYNYVLAQISGVFSYGEESAGKRRSLLLWNGGSGSTYYSYSSGFAANVQIASLATGTNAIVYNLFDVSGNMVYGSQNGGSVVSGSNTLSNPASTPIYLFKNGLNQYLIGNIFEAIIYNSDQSSNRTGIRDNMNTYYSVY